MKVIKVSFIIIGLFFLLISIVAIFFPELIHFLPFVKKIISEAKEIGWKRTMFLISSLILLIALFSARSKGYSYSYKKTENDDKENHLNHFEKIKPEEISNDSGEIIGQGLSKEISESVEKEDVSEIKERLRKTTKEIISKRYGLSSEKAEEKLQEGKWTDKRVAACFIESDLDYPIYERLRAWLEGNKAIERRIRQTVLAVEDLKLEGESNL